MLSRWGQDFVTARGMGDQWGDMRDQCIAVAVDDPAALPEMTRLALAGYAQSDDVEAAATMALNIAAMEADRL
jgi:hypothetical protein